MAVRVIGRDHTYPATPKTVTALYAGPCLLVVDLPASGRLLLMKPAGARRMSAG